MGILCLQETHKPKSDYWVSEEGYVIILSGGPEGVRENAGVGFMIAPWMRKSVVSFCQASPRMACLKIRIQGGKMNILSAYAPHTGYDFSDRQHFFHALAEFVNKQSAHGPKLIYLFAVTSMRGCLDSYLVKKMLLVHICMKIKEHKSKQQQIDTYWWSYASASVCW